MWLAHHPTPSHADVVVQVDLLVPEAVSPGKGRRAARLRGHEATAARIVRGLEGAVVDFDTLVVTALEPRDTRAVDAKVAGPAALLVAKVHKLDERQGTPRSNARRVTTPLIGACAVDGSAVSPYAPASGRRAALGHEFVWEDPEETPVGKDPPAIFARDAAGALTARELAETSLSRFKASALEAAVTFDEAARQMPPALARVEISRQQVVNVVNDILRSGQLPAQERELLRAWPVMDEKRLVAELRATWRVHSIPPTLSGGTFLVLTSGALRHLARNADAFMPNGM